MTNGDDSRLVRGIAEGDRQTYQEVFDTYYLVLVLYARKHVADMDQARTIVQDVMVQIFEKRASLQIHTSLKSYLYKAVHRACLNTIREEQTRQKYHQEWGMNEGTEVVDDSQIEVAELEARIHQAIEQLPDRCREVFKRSRYDQLTNQEIADQLGLSKRTVETQISLALARLRKEVLLLVLLSGKFFD